MTDVRLLEAVVPNLAEGWYCVLGLKNGKFVSQEHYKTLAEVVVESDRLVAAKLLKHKENLKKKVEATVKTKWPNQFDTIKKSKLLKKMLK